MSPLAEWSLLEPYNMPTRSPASRRTILVLAVVIVALVVAVIVLAVTRKSGDDDGDHGNEAPQQTSPPGTEKFDFFRHYNKTDGLDVAWYTGDGSTDWPINSLEDVKKMVKGDFDVVETEIIASSADTIVIRHTTLYLADMLLKMKGSRVAVKLDLVSVTNTTQRVLDMVELIDGSGFENPVFLTVPVISDIFDVTRFADEIKDKKLKGTFIVNFDVSRECCDKPIGRGLLEYIEQLARKVNLPASIEIDANSIAQYWQYLKWFMDKNTNIPMIISTRQPPNDANTSNYDILLARNDMDLDRMLYNLGHVRSGDFRTFTTTTGSALHYFNIHPRDAGNIIWSHNTDTWEQLNAATQGEVMMIEGDIQLFGQGTVNQTEEPIMGHDYGDWNNLTFEQWLDEIIKVDKGMKFDFKSLGAVKPALEITNSKKHLIKGPVWLNADILQGPGAGPPRIPAEDFLQAVQSFPEATLSIGWTTISKGNQANLNYTMDMMEEMYAISKNLPQPITFPVRAEQLVASWDSFDWLLSQSRGYTLTVWTSYVDDVTKADMDYIKRLGEASRIYFDLPEDLRPSF